MPTDVISQLDKDTRDFWRRRLSRYTDWRRTRTVEIAVQLIASKVEKGEIAETKEAILKELPDALQAADATLAAVEDYLRI